MATSSCPNESQIRAYLLGEGTSGDFEAIAKHLEGCPDCERVIQRAEEQAQTFLGRLQSAFPEGSIGEQAPDDLRVTRPLVEKVTNVLPDLSQETFQYADQPDSTVRSIADPRPNGQLTLGTTVRYFGDYEIQSVIGRGGMGVVYRAKQVSLNRPVALKMIKSGVLADDSELRRFQNEAEAVALLDHPGIVPLYEVGEHDGQRYFSMKLIEGGNLADLLASFKDDLGVAVAMLAETTDAVQHAHIRGVLHRDLKPANILIDTARHPHITDFGLARRLEGNVEMTATGVVMGTPAYMSPEQAAGHHGAITTATDVYGLGAILYAMLTGKAPFDSDSVIESLDAVRNRLPVAPRKLNAKVHRDLELICLKCLEKNPIDRYPTAASLADDLRRFAAGESVSVRAAGFVERSAKWARRKPTLAAAYALGSLALLLGGLGGIASWQWREAERARSAAELARSQAVQSRADAELARGQAERLRSTAELQRDWIERIEYGRTIEVAHQEWRDNNIAATLALLKRSRSDLKGWEFRYLERICHSDLMTFYGHTADLCSASFSPDGSRIVTASLDGSARLWDVSTGIEIRSIRGHAGPINSANFSPDGLRIVTAGKDATATIWDAETGDEICILRGHASELKSASFSPDGLRVVTTCEDTAVKIWDSRTGLVIQTIKGSRSPFQSAKYTPDGLCILTTSEDSTATIWDAETGNDIRTFRGHSNLIESANFSPDRSRLVTASLDKTVKVWDASKGTEILTIRGHTAPVASATFSPDGGRIVTASWDNTARVWDASTGVESQVLRGHSNFVISATFSPDGRWILTSSRDDTAKLWDTKTSPGPVNFGNFRSVVTSSTFSPDGSLILTTSMDGKAQLWDTKTRALRRTLTRTLTRTFDGSSFAVLSATFSADGSRIVTANADTTAQVWETRTGRELLTLKGHALGGAYGGIEFASFSPDGSRIVTASWDGTAKIWDSATGVEILTLRGHGGGVRSASFSPDGRYILTSSADQTARLWDATTGLEIRTFRGHSGSVKVASFSPDGLRLVTASDDMTAKVWDAMTGAEAFTLRGHTLEVVVASFSPDGSRIVTASFDSKAKIWDATTGIEVLTLKGHSAKLGWASWSPDGSYIMTASADNTAKIWDARPLPSGRPNPLDLDEYKMVKDRMQAGVAAFQQGRFEAARVDLHQASEGLQAFRASRPDNPQMAREHGISLIFLAGSLRELKRPGEALGRFRESLAILESIKIPIPNDLYNMACACAMISALNDQALSGDREKLEARAVEYLRRAIANKNPQIVPMVANDRDLDPLRGRADFRDLMADAIFPSDPFLPPPPLLTQAELINEVNSLLAVGQTVAAVRFLSDASTLDPGNTWLLLHAATLQAWFDLDGVTPRNGQNRTLRTRE